MNTLVKKNILKETENIYFKNGETNFYQQLKTEDQRILKEVIADYGKMNSNALIKHTYLNFPFFAIRSSIAKDILQSQLYERVEKVIPKAAEATLFTIGYEGISLELYLQKLVRNNVKILVDVRKNPLSMKFGFSKTLLKRYCNSLDIEYCHIPEVGIDSDKRQLLETQKDYDRLFDEYRKTTLKKTIEIQNQILDLLKKHKRIALTCFEADSCQCHRSHLATSISNLPDFNYPLVHL
jgi:uncharacterized protein (DUF488 family)